MDTGLIVIIALFVIFQIKHFLADYVWQGSYMFGKFKSGPAYILPLLAHVSVHGALTTLIVWAFTNNIWYSVYSAVFDMTIHFLMDRIKASPNLMGRWKANTNGYTDKERRDNRLFWVCLGFDQMIHHLTDYVIIYFIIRYILVASQTTQMF